MDSKKEQQKKNTSNVIFQIWIKPYLEVVWNVIPVSFFTAASQSGYSGCSNQISNGLLMQHKMIMSKPVTEMPRRIHTVTTAWNVTIYVTLDYKTSLKSLGYICSNSQNRLYESKWSIFLLCQKKIRILSKDHVPWRYFVNFLLLIYSNFIFGW